MCTPFQHRILFAASAIALFIGCNSSSRPERQAVASNPWVLHVNGIGPAEVGMTVEQLNSVLGEHFTTPTGEKACFYLKPKEPRDIGFMMLEGSLARVDVSGPDVATKEGVRVGDSEDQVKRIYGPKLE